jgi:hypothetical protein
MHENAAVVFSGLSRVEKALFECISTHIYLVKRTNTHPPGLLVPATSLKLQLEVMGTNALMDHGGVFKAIERVKPSEDTRFRQGSEGCSVVGQ